MQLPERLQHRRFVEWNYLVKGLIEVWEIARFLHMEAYLEQQLEEDVDGSLTDWLGHLGNRRTPPKQGSHIAQRSTGNDTHLQMLHVFVLCVAQDTLPDPTTDAIVRFREHSHLYTT